MRHATVPCSFIKLVWYNFKHIKYVLKSNFHINAQCGFFPNLERRKIQFKNWIVYNKIAELWQHESSPTILLLSQKVKNNITSKNPANGRHWISRPMRILSPLQWIEKNLMRWSKKKKNCQKIEVVTCHLSIVTCHLSPASCHFSSVTCNARIPKN